MKMTQEQFDMQSIVDNLSVAAHRVVGAWDLFFPEAKTHLNEAFLNHIGPIRENRTKLRYQLSQDGASKTRTLVISRIHALGGPRSGVPTSVTVHASFSADRVVNDE